MDTHVPYSLSLYALLTSPPCPCISMSHYIYVYVCVYISPFSISQPPSLSLSLSIYISIYIYVYVSLPHSPSLKTSLHLIYTSLTIPPYITLSLFLLHHPSLVFSHTSPPSLPHNLSLSLYISVCVYVHPSFPLYIS